MYVIKNKTEMKTIKMPKKNLKEEFTFCNISFNYKKL